LHATSTRKSTQHVYKTKSLLRKLFGYHSLNIPEHVSNSARALLDTLRKNLFGKQAVFERFSGSWLQRVTKSKGTLPRQEKPVGKKWAMD
jgi:hypothetical protein